MTSSPPPQNKGKGGNDAHVKEHIAIHLCVQSSLRTYTLTMSDVHLLFFDSLLLFYNLCNDRIQGFLQNNESLAVLVLQYCCQASKYIVKSENSAVFQGFIVFPVKGKKVMSKPLMFTGVDL